MRTSKQKLQIEQLDKKFASLLSVVDLNPPVAGWIKTLRSLLNISLRQVAAKLKKSISSVKESEEREAAGTITLQNLSQIAEAMNMRLFYMLIPVDGSLTALIEKKAHEMSSLQSQLEKDPSNLFLKDQLEEKEEWLKGAGKRPLKQDQILVESPNAGTAFILVLRETFKNPVTVGLYSIFVLVAAYHGFNGLWTFMITWGVTLTKYSQKIMRRIAGGLMLLVSFLGLMAAIGTYLSLKY